MIQIKSQSQASLFTYCLQWLGKKAPDKQEIKAPVRLWKFFFLKKRWPRSRATGHWKYAISVAASDEDICRLLQYSPVKQVTTADLKDEDKSPLIARQEFFAVVVPSNIWKNKRIILNCDHESIKIINSKRSQTSWIMDHLHQLTLLTLKHITSGNIPRKYNETAHFLSRFSVSKVSDSSTSRTCHSSQNFSPLLKI